MLFVLLVAGVLSFLSSLLLGVCILPGTVDGIYHLGDDYVLILHNHQWVKTVSSVHGTLAHFYFQKINNRAKKGWSILNIEYFVRYIEHAKPENIFTFILDRLH